MNQSFTLCATTGNSSYEWSGPGLASTPSSRCVTINGRAAGSYTYQLIVRSRGVEVDRCTHTVAVGNGGGYGTLQCAVTGPTTIVSGGSAELCAPSSSRHSYRWYGPAGFTASTRCIRATSPGTYQLSIVNDLTGSVRECSHVLSLAGSGGGSARCFIDGPEVISGANVRLCAPSSADYTYRWEGPNGFSSSARCLVTATPGRYYLTVRSRTTGAEEQCTHDLSADDTSTEGCSITGPNSFRRGTAADLCSQSYPNATYAWTGPGNFRSSSRCIRVTVPGTYRITIRDRSTGALRECSFTLDEGDDVDNADDVVAENCPRALPFWQQQCRRAADGRSVNPNDFTLADLRQIARRVDEMSTQVNWPDDVAGFCAALNPSRPLTNRKQVMRHYVAMLANVAAGELGIETSNGRVVSLDPDTPGSFSSASTVGELIALTERMLTRGRGNYAALAQQLNAVNRGRGIGTVCQ